MIQKIKKFKRNLIERFAQSYADYLTHRLQTALDLEDEDLFWQTYEQAAQLNAYCIVFHEIYLD